MAGIGPGFDARAFRDAITFVQQMAAPPDVDDQVTFYFPTQLVYTVPADGEEVPFDPAATVTRQVPLPVRVPCSVRYFDANGELSAFGVLTPTRVQITVLDEHYAKIEGCAYVVIAGDKYVYRRTEPPSGLFDVGLFALWFHADSET